MQFPRLLRFAAVSAALAACAAAQDHFPLQVGNQWVYRTAGTRAGAPLVMEIPRAEIMDARTWHLLRGAPGGEYWLRMSEDGKLIQRDDSGQEKLWYDFNAPAGQPFESAAPSRCCGQAVIAAHEVQYSGPLGDFTSTTEIRFPGVFQVGVERELFLPYVGMLFRSEATGGPSVATYHLSYARLGGVTYISEPELAMTIASDRSVYTPGAGMIARLRVRNSTGHPVQLNFPTGQSFDFVIRNEAGDIVQRWSEGKFFTQALRSETLAPGERNYVASLPLAGRDGSPLPAGRYTLEGWLTTRDTPEKAYSAMLGFEVAEVTTQ